MKAKLNFSNCTHIYFKDSTCRDCIDICPIDGIFSTDDYKIIMNNENCVGCGACYSVCPTGAFDIPFNVGKFIQNLANEEEKIISCKANVPCISILSSQDLISAVLQAEEDIFVDVGWCSDCQIGQLKEYIIATVEEANYFLERAGIDNRVKEENLQYQSKSIEAQNRRNFLKRLGKLSLGLTFWAVAPKIPVEENEEENTGKNIVAEKVLPQKRKVLLNTLKEKNLNLEDKTVDVDRISFTSDKWIEFYKCTNCSICYNICPTGALKGIDGKTKIQFEPSLCVKCRVCHESCPEDCLHLEKELNLQYFLEGKKILAEHTMIQCAECLIPFSYKGDSVICPRCQQLEDEIKEMLEFE